MICRFCQRRQPVPKKPASSLPVCSESCRSCCSILVVTKSVILEAFHWTPTSKWILYLDIPRGWLNKNHISEKHTNLEVFGTSMFLLGRNRKDSRTLASTRNETTFQLHQEPPLESILRGSIALMLKMWLFLFLEGCPYKNSCMSGLGWCHIIGNPCWKCFILPFAWFFFYFCSFPLGVTLQNKSGFAMLFFWISELPHVDGSSNIWQHHPLIL